MEFKNKFDQQFTAVSREILANGRHKEERNGLRISLFGQTLRSDLKDGLPIHTQKYTAWKVALREWLAMIDGGTNAADFKSKIWEQWGLSKDEVRLSLKGRDEVLKLIIEKFNIDRSESVKGFIEKGAITVTSTSVESGESQEITEAISDLHSEKELTTAVNMHNASEYINRWFLDFGLKTSNVDVARDVTIIIAGKLADKDDDEIRSLIKSLPVDNAEFVKEMYSLFGDVMIDRKVIAEAGYLGPIYGAVWTGALDGVDQIANLEEAIKRGGDTRMVIDGWVPSRLPDPALSQDENILNGNQVLPPCHVTYVFDLFEGTLNLEMIQRSGDWWIGVPFNHIEMAYWVEALAYVHGLTVGEIKHNVTNAHVYGNQIEAFDVDTYLDSESFALPRLVIDAPEAKSIKDLKFEDFSLEGYESGPAIAMPVSA